MLSWRTSEPSQAPSASTGVAVSLGGLEKRWGSFAAVDDVSLDIAPGEFLTLLGPSGSGKTTVLNLIAGFVAPDAGAIRFDGRDVTGEPPERRHLGMVFQSYSLFPHMTVAENVAFPLRTRGHDRRREAEDVAAALRLVQLEDLGQRYPRQLSGGQQQRIAFARAIAAKPRLLLMDEPLAALDLKLREQMQFEIGRLRRAIGATVVYVTHDQGEAMSLSDRIAVLNGGRIVQIGTPAEIYDRPRTRFVATFIGQATLLQARPAGRDEIVLDDLAEPFKPAGIDLGAAAGQSASICLRPEKMRRLLPGETLAGDERALDAVVQEAAFFGDSFRYLARTGSGQSVLMIEPRRGGVILERGDPVTCAFKTADAVLVRDDVTGTP